MTNNYEKLEQRSAERRRRRKSSAKKKKSTEFSKVLLIQESVLIWIMSLAFLALAYVCIINQYFGELPWLAAMVAFPWTAYGVSQGFYYKKAMAENTKDGIKYESVVTQLQNGQVFDENAFG